MLFPPFKSPKGRKNPSDKYSYHWDFNTKIAAYNTQIATDAL
ncbi:hypothetical protein [Lactococcus formosensis]